MHQIKGKSKFSIYVLLLIERYTALLIMKVKICTEYFFSRWIHFFQYFHQCLSSIMMYFL